MNTDNTQTTKITLTVPVLSVLLLVMLLFGGVLLWNEQLASRHSTQIVPTQEQNFLHENHLVISSASQVGGISSYKNTLLQAGAQVIIVSPTEISQTRSILALHHPRKPTLPQKPVVSGPSCISVNDTGTGVTIVGGAVNPEVEYSDISTDPNFRAYYRKNMLGSISVSGISGFLLYPEEKEQLLLQPNSTYYIRFFNGLPNTDGYGAVTTFSFPLCRNEK